MNFKNLSRLLRQNSTDVEKFVWSHLRNKQLGYRFYRQYSIDNKYIVDFICRKKGLVIECDGGQHNDNLEDKIRDAYLIAKGYKVLHFWNNDILTNWDGCCQIILDELAKE